MARYFHGCCRRRSPFEVLNFSSLLNPQVPHLAVLFCWVRVWSLCWHAGSCFLSRNQALLSVKLTTTVVDHRSRGNSCYGRFFTLSALTQHYPEQQLNPFDIYSRLLLKRCSAFLVTHHVKTLTQWSVTHVRKVHSKACGQDCVSSVALNPIFLTQKSSFVMFSTDVLEQGS